MVSLYLGTFTKLQKVTMSSVMSGSMEQLDPAGWLFTKLYTLGFYQNWAKIMGVFHKYLCTSMTAFVISVTMVSIVSN